MLSRIWYLVLAIGLALMAALAFILVDELNDQRTRAADRSLVRDLRELDMALALEAHRRVSAIAGLAVNGDLRAALITHQSGQPVDRNNLEHALKNLDAQLGEGSADRLMALSIDGTIVADIGANTRAPSGAGLGAFPFVRDALRGYLTDDIMLYDGELYRFVARPVVDQGRYIGAIAHGKKLDARFAAHLSRLLPDTAIAFYLGDSILGSSIPGTLRLGEKEFTKAIQERGERIEQRASAPFSLGDGAQGLVAAMIGSAASADAGVALVREVKTLRSPLELIPAISEDAIQSLPLPMLAGGALLLALIGWLFYSIEAVRPRRRFAHAAANLAEDGGSRLKISEMPRAFRAIAGSINDALEAQAARAGVGTKAAELSSLLEEEAGAEEERSSYFGFSSEPPPPSDAAAAEAEAGGLAPPPAPFAPTPAERVPPEADAPTAAPPEAKEADPFGTPEDLLEDDSDEPVGGPAADDLFGPPAGYESPLDGPFAASGPRGEAPPAPPAVPPPPAPPAPVETAPSAAESATPTPVAPVPDSPPPSIPTSPRVPAFDPHGFDDDDEGATTVAEIPQEIIAQIQKPIPEPEDPELAHFKQVFEEYVAMRESLGEPTAGLTFERFETTLRKNRDAIVERHGVSTVRFTVYNKDGKAALRATPVK